MKIFPRTFFFRREVSLRIQSLLVALIFSGATMVSLAVIAYSSFKGGVFAALFGLVCGATGFASATFLIPLLIFSFPVSGVFQNLFAIRGLTWFMLPILATSAGWAFRQAITRHKIVVNLPWPVGLYFVASIFSVVVALVRLSPHFPNLDSIISSSGGVEVRLVNAIGWILTTACGALCVLVVFVVSRRPRVQINFHKTLLWSVVPTILFGLAQFYGFTNLGTSALPEGQYNSTFIDQNGLGLWSAVMFLLIAGSVADRRAGRLPWLIGPGVLFLTLISGCRSAFFLLLIGMPWLMISALVRLRWRVHVFLAACLVIGTLLVHHRAGKDENRIAKFTVNLSRSIVGYVVGPSGAVRGSDPFETVVRENLGDRIVLWQAGWVVFKHDPIIGSGLGSYLFTMPKYKNTIVKPLLNDNSGNMYLHVAAEQGVVGLAVFVLLIGSGLTAWSRSTLSRDSLLHIGALSASVGLAASFIFGAHLLSFEVAVLFWYLLGLMFSEPSSSDPEPSLALINSD